MVNLVVIFNSQVSAQSMGGGDKIVLKISNLLKTKFNLNVLFAGCPEGKEMLENNVKDIPFIFLNKISITSFGFFISYILRIFLSPFILFSHIKNDSMLWSASDFLPDTFPAFIFKIFNRKSKWISSMFLVARNPFKKEVVLNFRTFFYFLSQRISIYFFKLMCDGVFVLCEADRKFLCECGISKDKIFKTSGGVDLPEFNAVISPVNKIYDACFVGRFHYQKGIDDLLYVWKKVVEKISDANLAIVGWGDTQNVNNINSLIEKNKLKNNIHLLGFLDGEEKIKVLKSSKVLLFPSSFESWGVVVAEGIVSHIPVVAYDFPVLKDNFKKGLVWVNALNKDQFFEKTLELIQSENLRNQIVKDAGNYVSSLDWSFVAESFFRDLKKI